MLRLPVKKSPIWLPIRLILGLLLAAACTDAPETGDASLETVAATDPQLVFWASLESLCGQAFEGRIKSFQNSGMKQIFWGQPSGPNSLDRATAILFG